MVSVISYKYLARTIAASQHVREWMILRGHSAACIAVTRLGIDPDRFTPVSDPARASAKAQVLKLPSSTTVVAVIGRLEPQKRPLLVPDIAAHLVAQGVTDFQIVMVGDGSLSRDVRNRIAYLEIGQHVRTPGPVSDPQRYLVAADIFLLPSMSEGLSIAIAEAMAMQIPIVTSGAGASPEQLGYEFNDTPGKVAGIIVNHTLEDTDAGLYAQALMRLIDDQALRRQMGIQGREWVQNYFNANQELPTLFRHLDDARRSPCAASKDQSDPAAYYAISNALYTQQPLTDFAVQQYQLQMPVRDGFGKFLQERCGEHTPELTAWIDSIEGHRLCSAEDTLDVQVFVASASRQCLQWYRCRILSWGKKLLIHLRRCIFDISTSDIAGWAFDGVSEVDVVGRRPAHSLSVPRIASRASKQVEAVSGPHSSALGTRLTTGHVCLGCRPYFGEMRPSVTMSLAEIRQAIPLS